MQSQQPFQVNSKWYWNFKTEKFVNRIKTYNSLKYWCFEENKSLFFINPNNIIDNYQNHEIIISLTLLGIDTICFCDRHVHISIRCMKQRWKALWIDATHVFAKSKIGGEIMWRNSGKSYTASQYLYAQDHFILATIARHALFLMFTYWHSTSKQML